MQFRWLGAVGLAATALWTLVGLPGRTRVVPARPPQASARPSENPAHPRHSARPAAQSAGQLATRPDLPNNPPTMATAIGQHAVAGPTSAEHRAGIASSSHLTADLTKILATDKNPSLARPAASNWLTDSADPAVSPEHASWGAELLNNSTSDTELSGFGQLTDATTLPLDGTRPRDLSHQDTAEPPPTYDPHAELFARQRHPSARECATCHPRIFAEWSVSAHAYATISPMYHRLADTLASCGPGPLEASCRRCHSPEPPAAVDPGHGQSILAQSAVAQEGVTCVACHRPLTADDDASLAKTTTPPNAMPGGSTSHLDQPLQFPIRFAAVSEAEFCVTCHQVAVHPDVSVPLMWNQYCASPAAKEGTTCQDCHMGQVPGVANGYATGPVAVVDGHPVNVGRKHSNHVFYGPNYSIAHPGVFPIPATPSRWTTEQWLQFDWRAGWGSDPYEQQVAGMTTPPAFPECWTSAADRRAGYQQLLQNVNLLNEQRTLRRQLLENNSQVRGPLFSSAPTPGRPLSFEYVVTNLNSGHHFPTGSLDARPQRWLNVVLTGPNGERLWESGYLDSQGNLADDNSQDVAAGRIAKDEQLVQYRTRFVTANDDGTDHEMLLPLHPAWLTSPSASIDPQRSPFATLTRPPLIRPEPQSIPPLGNMHAQFRVPASALSQPGRYRLSVRMRYQSSAIYYLKLCRATPEMERNMLEGSLDFHQQSFEFDVK